MTIRHSKYIVISNSHPVSNTVMFKSFNRNKSATFGFCNILYHFVTPELFCKFIGL